MTRLGLVCVAAMAAGCVQQPTTTTPQLAASGTQDATLNQLSCTTLTARHTEIARDVAERQSRQSPATNQNAIANAALNVGVGVLIGRAGGGNLESIRTASAVGSGMQDVFSQQGAQGPLSGAEDSLALAREAADIQRAMITKGC